MHVTFSGGVRIAGLNFNHCDGFQCFTDKCSALGLIKGLKLTSITRFLIESYLYRILTVGVLSWRVVVSSLWG